MPGFDGLPLVNCLLTAAARQPVEDTVVFTGFFTPASVDDVPDRCPEPSGGL